MTALEDRPETSTAPERLPDLGRLGGLRWLWRRLTSMRTALVLLLLLALATIPGSLFPQRSVDAGAVATYEQRHPDLAPWLDRLGCFTVFSSPWFAAVYLLLFTSLVGCIVPRAGEHVRDWRARPPAAPGRLERLAGHQRWQVPGTPGEVAPAAAGALRRGWSVVVDQRPDGVVEVAAQRGRLRETGNLVFHTSMIFVLVALAGSALYSWRGQALVVEGSGFADTLPAYDSFTPGPRFATSQLPPFSLTVDALDVRFEESPTAGFAAPRDFRAAVTVTDEPGGATRRDLIRVNEPLAVDGAKVYLTGNGYAPVVQVRRPDGTLVHDGAVPFLPQDGYYTSEGVVKVPDTVVAGGGDLALQGLFLPTGVIDEQGPHSVFPDARDPLLVLTAATGDLGLDDGVPRSVFSLDGARLDPVVDADGRQVTFALRPGETATLPDGSTVTFAALPRFVALDVRADPTGALALVSSILVILGLAASLFLPRRRAWIRLTPTGADAGDSRTVVEVAGQSRPRDVGLVTAIAQVADQVRTRLPAAIPPAVTAAAAAPGNQES